MNEKMNDVSLEIEDIAEESTEPYGIESEEIDSEEKEERYEDETDDSDSLDDGKEDDMEELRKHFPEIAGISSIAELKGAEKYLKFRELGLSPTEAYLATGGGRIKERPRPASPVSVRRRDEGIPDRQLRMARELFSEMSDTEIQALYRRVTK